MWDGDKVYYVETIPDGKGEISHYLFYFDGEGHTMQVNLPAALGRTKTRFRILR